MAWDSSACARDPDLFMCQAAWCFVDASNCASLHDPAISTFRGVAWDGGSVTEPRPAIAYSFETCGWLDWTASDEAMARLIAPVVGRTFRVSAPFTTNPTTLFWRTDEAGSLNREGSQWNGPVWQMWSDIAASLNSTLQQQNISDRSLAMHLLSSGREMPANS